MVKFSSKFILITLLAVFILAIPSNKATAMEPISMAMMLAPIVIPILKAATPYIIKGAVNMGGAMFEAGVEMFNMLLFPIGLFEATLFAPWFFESGMVHMGEGAMALPKMLLQTLLVMPKTFGFM
jgi:hypothetical protein